MRISIRAWVSLAVVLALMATACSGGEDTTTPSYTVPPGLSTSEIEEGLEQLVEEMLSPPTGLPPNTEDPGYADPAAAVVGFWEATAAGQWDAAYASAAPHLAAGCDRREYDATASGLDDQTKELTFSTIELSVINDLAFGSFRVYDGTGTLPIEGLLAVQVDDAWYAYANPCEAVTEAATGGPSYPVVVTTVPLIEATIPAEATTTTVAVTTTTTSTTLPTEPPLTVPTTTTTLPPVVPLTADDKASIELIIRQFMQADAKQDWMALYTSVPPLFSCTPAEIAAAQAPYHYSPTAVSFGPFSIKGNDDEAYATFDVTYADTGETINVVDFGAWEWGGNWYAAIEPCLYSELLGGNGLMNEYAMANLNSALELARALYVDAGDYDIPLATLEALEPSFPWVGTAADAENGAVGYVNDGQKLLLVSQSLSGRWYCVAEQAGQPAMYASAAYAATIDTFDGCRAVNLANPWGPPA
jgi:hypothetical protein